MQLVEKCNIKEVKAKVQMTNLDGFPEDLLDKPIRKLFYGPSPDQFGHLYQSSGNERAPIMVVIHGGYWKDNHSLDSYATKAIVEHYAGAGVAIWNLEYRRMNAIGVNTTAPWPAIFEDVANGIDYLREIAGEYNLDVNRMLVIGHSAGGHLASWVASRSNISESSSLFSDNPLLPARTIAIASILDLRFSEGLSDPLQVQRLMGGHKDEINDSFAASNPIELCDVKQHITLIHGDNDVDVHVGHAHRYVSSSSNPNLRLIELANTDHFGMLPLEGKEPPNWQRLITIIDSELASL